MDLMKLLEYWNNGLRCADILVKLALDFAGEENDALIRSARALNAGLGASRGVCGSLTGCCLVIGYFTDSRDVLNSSVQEFAEWFKEKTVPLCGSVNCEDIIGAAGGCPRLVLDCYSKTMEILSEKGVFDEI
jgi:hypothetical protein